MENNENGKLDYILNNSKCGDIIFKTLVEQNKITIEEYESITGLKFETSLENLKKIKINFIDEYKHQARIYFPYGNVGGIQRFTEDDILCINLSLQGIESGVFEKVTWKYSNGNYEEADKEYLQNMLLKGGMLLNKAFKVEAEIVKQINEFNDYDALLLYNEKEEFDKLFNKED